jgi:hypothetical protein
MIIVQILLCFLQLQPSTSQFAMTNINSSLTSTLTLAQNVLYDLNFTFTNQSIS